MKFDKDIVEQYLVVVHDLNPVHDYIVPGQLVGDYALNILNLKWQHYKVKYLETIMIDEEVSVELSRDNQVIIRGNNLCIKMRILKL